MTEKIDPESVDPATMAADAITEGLPDLRAALLEMRSYEAVMGSGTAFYHYHLVGDSLTYADKSGLVLLGLAANSVTPTFRLTKFGREVAARLTEVQA